MVGHLADHNRTLDASILGNLADRRLQRPADDVDAGFLVFIVKQTLGKPARSSANDPKRTLPLALSSASEDRCGWPLSGVLNSC